MPNHITNIVRTSPEVARALVNDEGEVDFGRVIPMPADVFRGSLGIEERRKYPGEKNWYDWSVAHWGTKWNAYSSAVTGAPGDQAVVRFDTAWSHPFPVLEELSRKFPDARIEAEYADEDLGNNIGRYVLQGGAIVEQDGMEDGSDEALEFAAQLKYGMTYAELQAEFD